MSHQRPRPTTALLLSLAVMALLAPVLARQLGAQAPAASAPAYEVNDSHLHLTNYIQEGRTSTTS